VIGAGAVGFPAAIQAHEAGASVLLLEAQKDVGGHSKQECMVRRLVASEK